MTNSAYTFTSDRIISSFKWNDFRPTARWCEENINISGEVSGRTGYMSFDKYPWSEEILNDWDRDNLEEYSMEASTQVAKTTIQFCCIVKPLVEDPCLMMFVMASDKMVSDFVSEKFDTFIDGIAVLKERISVKQSEDSLRLKNAVKIVPGGRISFVGNTPISRRGKTVKYIFMDEIALYKHSDIEEFKSRTKSFEGLGRKIFMVSSPMYMDDPIRTAYDNSYCKKELHIICKKCDNSFYPEAKHFRYLTNKEYKDEVGGDFTQLEYKRKAIKTARVECPNCQNKIFTKDIETYVREKRVKLVVVDGNAELDTKIGYKLNALATGLTSYEKMAEKLIEAENDEGKLAGIYREYFNEIYESKLTKDILSSDIALLKNDYEEFEIPDDTLGLYMGVDSQKGYFWVTIIAIEFGLNPHLVWCGRVEDEATIESFMDRQWYYQDGTRYYAGIRRAYHDWQGYKTPQKELVTNEDTGEVVENMILDMPQKVKEFAYRMAQKYSSDSEGRERYYAVRGEQFLTNDEVFKFANTSFTVKEYLEERKLKTLVINTTSTKTTFMNTVVRNIAKCKATVDDEAYYWEDRLHYINKTLANKLNNREKIVNKDYDRQITSQKYANHKNERGKPDKYRSWKGTADDHFLDCNSYIMISIQMDDLSSRPKPQRVVSDEKTMAIAVSALTDW